METLLLINNLPTIVGWNYVIGYAGAITMILVSFNIWKNKLDVKNKISSFEKLLPELGKWSYRNIDDWLVMVLLTPVFIFFQNPLVHLIVVLLEKKMELNVDIEGFLAHHELTYLVSFAIGVTSQTIGVLLSATIGWITYKVKNVFK